MTTANYQAWDIGVPNSLTGIQLDRRIRLSLAHGLLAPSVHNTQPWRFELAGDDRVVISPEPSRALKSGDATNRQTAISLGACVENICEAAEALGLDATAEAAGHTISVRFKIHGQQTDRQRLDAIRNRRTNRSRYSSQAIPAESLRKLAKITQSPDIQVVVSDDPKLISLVAELTGRGIGMALSLPEFKAELAELMLPNWTRHPIGMPGFTLGKGLIRSVIDPIRFRRLPVGATERRREQELMQSAGAIGLVLSRGDTWDYWVEAGRTYQRLGITATRMGIDQATSAAAVEAPDFHLEIEDYIKTTYRLQTIMRLGYGQPAKHSPRLGLEAVLH